jgi:uncharacterized protein (DUF2225 family)
MPLDAPAASLMLGPKRPMLFVTHMQPHSRGPKQQKPSMRSLAEGQLLCQFGDPPGPLYIILSGKLRVYRPNPNRPNENIELAHLGPGAVVGETAPILGQLRSASVRALEPSTLLSVPVDQLGVLTRAQAPLARVIVQALHQRAGLSATEIAVMVGNLGIQLPNLAGMLETEEVSDDTDPPGLADSPQGAEELYPKTVTCPICQVPFSTQIVRLNKDKPVGQDSDFHQIYETGFNPYDYEPWVCPNDLYAALPSDFTTLTNDQRERMPAAIAELVEGDWGGERPDFGGDRNLALREQALQIALVVGRVRSALPLRMAAVQHRLAWCARERGDTIAEQSWLKEALASYSAAHEQGEGASAKEELRLGYLCGELSLRLGDQRAARSWFGQTLLLPDLKAHPMWQRLLRGQLEMARTPAIP